MATLIIRDLCIAEELDSEAMAEIAGGSIYVDGNYWGEGTINVHPAPGGFPVWNVWPDGTRTPH